jgi:AraC family transcriptional regulator, ethanolamine operon transcriptional activator
MVPYTVDFSSAQDADEQAERLKDWDQSYEQLSAGRFAGSLLAISFGHTRLFRERLTRSVHQRGVTHARYRTFAAALELSDDAYCRGARVDADALVSFEAATELDLTTPDVCECVAAELDATDFAAFAATVEHRDVGGTLERGAVVPVDPARQAALKTFLRETIELLTADPTPLAQDAAAQALRESVYLRLLDTIDWHVEPRADSASVRRFGLARRALAFVHDRLDEPVGIAELCRHVGCSRRTLQYCFHSAYGVSPLAYMRALRFNGARRALRQGPPEQTVQDVAARWGFWHLSRFSDGYRQRFGELPSATRARRRGAG